MAISAYIASTTLFHYPVSTTLAMKSPIGQDSKLLKIMSLQSLPHEIILKILAYIGCDSLWKDWELMLLNKQWHQLAAHFREEEYVFRPKVVRSFDVYNTQRNIRFCEGLSQRTTKATFVLEGVDATGAPGGLITTRGSGSPFNDELRALLQALSHFPKLREVRFYTQRHPFGLGEQSKPLFDLSTLSNLNSLQNLQHLTLDLRGTHAQTLRETKKVHHCEAISELLPRLTSFACRLAFVCPKLIPINTGSVNLRNIAINCCIDIPGYESDSYRYSSACSDRLSYDSVEYSFLTPASLNEIRRRLELLVKQMKKPNSAYLLCPHPNHGRRISYNLVKGKKYNWSSDKNLRDGWIRF